MRMMASGETAFGSSAEGEEAKNSQAKVPTSDETPKTNFDWTEEAIFPRGENLSGDRTEACFFLACLRFYFYSGKEG